ncbi:unnamed protein product [Tetraodon nigroviridis]|uniref:Carbonic anhydrase n=1 Tax=Tetraodon nigroviridis TaxID=99883 RepID=Q4RVK0_TETNG|nr:unnamed protein product [Tetraodon nigroviridis]
MQNVAALGSRHTEVEVNSTFTLGDLLGNVSLTKFFRPRVVLRESLCCDGERQSPINIEKKSVEVDENLESFTFTKFDDKHAIEQIVNTGHTVKCTLKQDTVEISGGSLEHVYSTLQFHFHWGSVTDGSEHTVDSHRYPMEMHIVSKRKDLTLDEAVQTPDGLAVLGFFIEMRNRQNKNSSQICQMGVEYRCDEEQCGIRKSREYRCDEEQCGIRKSRGSKAEVIEEISIDDLLGGMNRNDFYRYHGSLTTPQCNEVVVWTVFKEPVKMMMFPTQAGYHKVFRPTQPLHGRKIYSSSSASRTKTSVTLVFLLFCLCTVFNIPCL